VLKHENGTGRLQHMMGKIHCELPNGIKFKIGTGFSDAQRKNPPKVGAVVTFKYQEISNSGVPRFPVFLRIREDVTWDEVKQSAAKNKPFSEEKKKSFHLKKSHTVLYTTVPSRDQSTSKKQARQDFFFFFFFFSCLLM
jgi:ATP-dependent DNA ligase